MASTQTTEGKTEEFLLYETDLPEVVEDFVQNHVAEIFKSHQMELEIKIEQEIQHRMALINIGEKVTNEQLLAAILAQTEILHKLADTQAMNLASQPSLVGKNEEVRGETIQLECCLDEIQGLNCGDSEENTVVGQVHATNAKVNKHHATNAELRQNTDTKPTNAFLWDRVPYGLNYPPPPPLLPTPEFSSQTRQDQSQTRQPYGSPPLTVPSTSSSSLQNSLFFAFLIFFYTTPPLECPTASVLTLSVPLALINQSIFSHQNRDLYLSAQTFASVERAQLLRSLNASEADAMEAKLANTVTFDELVHVAEHKFAETGAPDHPPLGQANEQNTSVVDTFSRPQGLGRTSPLNNPSLGCRQELQYGHFQ